jgi:hypothetical protein
MNNPDTTAPPRGAPALPTSFTLAPMSRNLAHYAHRWAAGDEERPPVDDVPVAVASEAAARLVALDALLAPVDQRTILAWLEALAMAGLPRTPLDSATAAPQLRAIWEVCQTLPRCVWTDETRFAYLAVNRFWPVPADVFQHLNKHAEAFKRERGQCRAIIAIAARAKERPAPHEKVCPSAAAMEEVSKLLASTRVPTTGKRSDLQSAFATRQQMPSRPINQLALLAGYERDAQTNPNAAMRAASRLRAERIRAALTANQNGYSVMNNSENDCEARLPRPP